MYVACSTDCFAMDPLPEALRAIGQIGFNKVDVTVDENSQHLKPSEVTTDIHRIAQRLRLGGGLSVAAFRLDFAEGISPEGAAEQLQSLCRLARVLATPLVSIEAAKSGSDREQEVVRLTHFSQLAQSEGVCLAIETKSGTLTEDPDVAIELCERVPGLGIALDPSYYILASVPVKSIDPLFKYVQHVRFRDTSKKLNQFQVKIGQGEVEYGRIISQLARFNYQRSLSIDMIDEPKNPFPMQPEVRKLKYLLESMI